MVRFIHFYFHFFRNAQQSESKELYSDGNAKFAIEMNIQTERIRFFHLSGVLCDYAFSCVCADVAAAAIASPTVQPIFLFIFFFHS